MISLINKQLHIRKSHAFKCANSPFFEHTLQFVLTPDLPPMTSPEPTRVWALLQSDAERRVAHLSARSVLAFTGRIQPRHGREEPRKAEKTGEPAEKPRLVMNWSAWEVVCLFLRSFIPLEKLGVHFLNYYSTNIKGYYFNALVAYMYLFLLWPSALEFAELAVRFASFLQSSASHFIEFYNIHLHFMCYTSSHPRVTDGRKIVSICIC